MDMREIELLGAEYIFDDGNIVNPLNLPDGFEYAGRNDLDMCLATNVNDGKLFLINDKNELHYIGPSVQLFIDLVEGVKKLDYDDANIADPIRSFVARYDSKLLSDPNGFWSYYIEGNTDD